jgi:K+-sensing histidine kinase KdpD
MSNIERHTPIDAKVRIKARNDKDSVLVTFEDGGPFRGELGFDLENYLTRFNPARSSSKGGSGLGFSIIAKSVNKLSGRIQLFPSEIGGLGIAITLPKS